MSIVLVMPSKHLMLCCPLLLLPSIFPSIRVFSIESALHIRWPKYWSFSFNISPSNEYSGLTAFRIDWFDFLAVQGTSRVFSNTTVQKRSNTTLGTEHAYTKKGEEKKKVKVAWSCPTLCKPRTVVHRIIQARILEWVAVPFSRGSSQPRNRTQDACIVGWFFTSWAIRDENLTINSV